jgi:hypothetical protein
MYVVELRLKYGTVRIPRQNILSRDTLLEGDVGLTRCGQLDLVLRRAGGL